MNLLFFMTLSVVIRRCSKHHSHADCNFQHWTLLVFSPTFFSAVSTRISLCWLLCCVLLLLSVIVLSFVDRVDDDAMLAIGEKLKRHWLWHVHIYIYSSLHILLGEKQAATHKTTQHYMGWDKCERWKYDELEERRLVAVFNMIQ